MPIDALVVGSLLAIVNSKLVDYLAAPLKKRFPDLDLWWLLYVSLATGFAIGWFGSVNLFAGYVDNVLLGRVLSSLLVGGGSSLIYDIFDRGEQGA